MPDGSVPTHDSVFADVLPPASFMSPEWYPPSAWTEHAPFAFWLVEALRPRSYVELGTSYGYSFFAVCQMVEKLGLKTECTAIDTWRGDDHAGFYSDHVYNLVREHAEKRFPARAA